ncbi:hypothetical protein [Methylobacterium sp. J-076]|uniref:hypothetical protein n=1 Tax=Methylobacterium sp. J-076 TaxID=2836655 RepID=UPI001FBB1DA2|nr:hypothetical protein [Methylobacterium sp. J-076]MCJ2014739.1 hypothetical protein [Methylobacterium sp. J-076]
MSSKVELALKARSSSRDNLISYLRDLETEARIACDRRQTIQIIASGRSLLGDRTTLPPHDGPFSRM